MPESAPKRAQPRPRKRKLGWKEWVAFPKWGIDGIRTKVDTGARTSALHATDLEEVEVDGVPGVRFLVQCERDPDRPPVSVTLPVADRRQVRDSGGREEMRPVVVAAVEVRGYRGPIEVTLTRRDDMEFNMLLGRRGISGRFFVDPELAYIGGDPPPRRRKPAKKKTSRKTNAAAKKKASSKAKESPVGKKTSRKTKSPVAKKKAPPRKKKSPAKKKASSAKKAPPRKKRSPAKKKTSSRSKS